jgi:hypothetical protein
VRAKVGGLKVLSSFFSAANNTGARAVCLDLIR